MNTQRTAILKPIIATLALALAPMLLAAPPASPIADARQQRADLLLNEIKASDARIEKRISVIVDGLAGVADTKDSKTKVARLKEDTIQGLMKNAESYRNKRDTIREQLRRPTLNLTVEQKTKILDALNSRIERRVAQILELQKSLPSHQDYERYKVVGSTWVGAEYARNEDYDQNRRVTQYTNTAQKKVLDGLSLSVTALQQQNRNLQASIAAATTPAQHQALTAEMQRNEALIQERQRQRAETLKGQESATRSVSRKEAENLDQALKQATTDLRADFTTLFARYNAYIQALSELNATRAAAPARS